MKPTTDHTGTLSAFVPLERLQSFRNGGASHREVRAVEPHAADFILRAGDEAVTFRYGVDFVEGNERLRWTPAGIDRLIAAGLWRREFDKRGNLKTKPPTPAAAMKFPGARVLD